MFDLAIMVGTTGGMMETGLIVLHPVNTAAQAAMITRIILVVEVIIQFPVLVYIVGAAAKYDTTIVLNGLNTIALLPAIEPPIGTPFFV